MDTRMRRREKKRNNTKRKSRIFLYIVLGFSLLFAATATYAVVQFEAGRQNSKANMAANSPDTDDSSEVTIVEAREPLNDEPINVLLIGVDTAENEPARTDTIMVAQFDAKQNEAKLASIMRDTYVEIPGRSNNKINAAFAFGGVELLRDTIELNFDLDIHYYAMVNFDGFVEVVDTVAPNGLEIDVERRMYYNDTAGGMTIDFQAGPQTFTGEDALKYVRFRNDSQNDFGRVQRQQEILNLLKGELISFSGITRVPRLIGAVEPHIETNIRTTKMLSMATDFVLSPVDDIQTLRIPVENGFTEVYYRHAGLVLEPDLEKNKDAIQSFFNSNQQFASETNVDDDSES